MKVLRDNIWNRIFHCNQLEEERDKYNECKCICCFYHKLYDQVLKSKDLLKLMNLHKDMWKKEFQNQNLAPCEYGIFRTKDISSMVADEVYLGGIYGLHTHPITFWQTYCGELMGPNGFGIPENTLIYDIVVKQYRTLLLENLNNIYFEALNYIHDYEIVNPFKLF